MILGFLGTPLSPGFYSKHWRPRRRTENGAEQQSRRRNATADFGSMRRSHNLPPEIFAPLGSNSNAGKAKAQNFGPFRNRIVVCVHKSCPRLKLDTGTQVVFHGPEIPAVVDIHLSWKENPSGVVYTSQKCFFSSLQMSCWCVKTTRCTFLLGKWRHWCYLIISSVDHLAVSICQRLDPITANELHWVSMLCYFVYVQYNFKKSAALLCQTKHCSLAFVDVATSWTVPQVPCLRLHTLPWGLVLIHSGHWIYWDGCYRLIPYLGIEYCIVWI